MEARPAPTAARTPAVAPPLPAPERSGEPFAGRGTSTDRDTDVLFHALFAIGVDYRPGGRSQQTGFDCSGLVAHVYRQAYGIALPRDARGQSESGDPVDPRELQAGDLVFFNTLGKPYSHVGISLGDGRFIHAPRQGAVVRTESMRVHYWESRFNGARRVVPAVIAAEYKRATEPSRTTFP